MYIQKVYNRTEILKAICRCDAKAQLYLPVADRVPLDVRCDCDGLAELVGMAREMADEERLNELIRG